MKTNEQNNLKTKTLIKKKHGPLSCCVVRQRNERGLRSRRCSEQNILVENRARLPELPFDSILDNNNKETLWRETGERQKLFCKNCNKASLCCVEWNWTETELLFQGFAFFLFLDEPNRTERNGLDWILRYLFSSSLC